MAAAAVGEEVAARFLDFVAVTAATLPGTVSFGGRPRRLRDGASAAQGAAGELSSPSLSACFGDGVAVAAARGLQRAAFDVARLPRPRATVLLLAAVGLPAGLTTGLSYFLGEQKT